MSYALSFSEIDGQHAELLPARTVLSMFAATGSGGGGESHSCVAGLINNVQIPISALNILGLGSGASATAC
jgi:hypothetical protein